MTIRLERSGALAGRLTDDRGDPLLRARVVALRRDALGASRRLMMAGSSSTDDRGQFRVFDLEPGEYYVLGESPASASPTREGRTGPAPTYYPGSTSLDGARVVTVRSGQDTAAIEFGLVSARLGRVSGTAVDSQGNPLASGSVSLAQRVEAYSVSRSASVRPDGAFVIAGVPPGDYYLSATFSRGTGPQAYREGAFVPVSVNGDDVSAGIRTNAGATVSGRVVIEGSAPAGAPMPILLNGVDVTRGMVSARPASSGPQPSSVSFGRSVPVRDDGTFELDGLRGTLILQASAGGYAAAFKAVLRGGEDLTGKGLALAGTERIDDIVIVLTTDVGALEGTVSDSQGRPPTAQLSVVVFPDDPGRWYFSSPFVRQGSVLTEMPPPPSMSMPSRPLTPQQEMTRWTAVVGGFFLSRLLPGRYWVVPCDTASGGMMPPEREALEKLRARATSVTIKAGERARVALTLGK